MTTPNGSVSSITSRATSNFENGDEKEQNYCFRIIDALHAQDQDEKQQEMAANVIQSIHDQHEGSDAIKPVILDPQHLVDEIRNGDLATTGGGETNSVNETPHFSSRPETPSQTKVVAVAFLGGTITIADLREKTREYHQWNQTCCFLPQFIRFFLFFLPNSYWRHGYTGKVRAEKVLNLVDNLEQEKDEVNNDAQKTLEVFLEDVAKKSSGDQYSLFYRLKSVKKNYTPQQNELTYESALSS